MSAARPLHMSQPCGCGLYLHGHSWEHIIEHGGADFVYCFKHAAAPDLRAALTLAADTFADYAQKLEELTAALEPFALLWSETTTGDETHVPCSIRRDDLRRAATAYLKATEPAR